MNQTVVIIILTAAIAFSASVNFVLNRRAKRAWFELDKAIERNANLQSHLSDAEIKLLGSQNDLTELQTGVKAYHDTITAPYGVKLASLRVLLFRIIGIEYTGGGLGE